MTGFKNQSLKRLITGLFICLLGAGLAGHASAQSQRLYVTEGQIEPIPVAIADFTGLDGTPSDVGRQIAQIISEDGAEVKVAASTLEAALREGPTGNIEGAAKVGALIAERAKAAGFEQVAFDRSGYKYHGRVKALADAAREAGLAF